MQLNMKKNEMKFYNLEAKVQTIEQVPFISGRIADEVDPLLELLFTELNSSSSFYNSLFSSLFEKQKELGILFETTKEDGSIEVVKNEDAPKELHAKALLDVIESNFKMAKGNNKEIREIYYKIAIAITNKKQLTTEWIESLNSIEVWNEQDWQEVSKYVECFRLSYEFSSKLTSKFMESLQKLPD